MFREPADILSSCSLPEETKLPIAKAPFTLQNFERGLPAIEASGNLAMLLLAFMASS